MHSLDVAAVGWELTASRPRLFQEMADRLGWRPEDFRDLWVFLLLLHDIGKFSEHFQAKAPDRWPELALGPVGTNPPRGSDPGHSAAGAALLFAPDRGRRPDLVRARFETWFPGWGDREEDGRRVLFAPILGHHGRPARISSKPLQDLFSPAAEAAALAFADASYALLRPPKLPEPSNAVLKRASWPLAGLSVLADWVGSNRDWFPYVRNGRSLQEYWTSVALPQARAALIEAGLAPSSPSRATGFRALTQLESAPSPAQAWAESVELPPGPLLVLVEDMTGGGKTEAALVLAHRLMAADRGAGIYFALPTMATANAMFDRIREAAPRLYAEGARPSLALAHGRADLHPAFRPPVVAGERTGEPEHGPPDDEDDSAVVAPAWLTSETRKALLADLGVGTVDQALLAVLPAKHQALRLAGLAEKVLVIDEAHAYDAYMGAELDRLVAFQAALGGSTIILSATLPKAAKARIAEAWRRAAKAGPVELAGDAYPGVTLLSVEAPPLEQALPPRSDLPRSLRITRLPCAEDAARRIAEAARAGAAVAWLRNTVDDVLAGAELLRGVGLDAQVFHARFAMGNRLAIEADVVQRFGREGTCDERRGHVLVGSQVLESSLDLDFDLMVSDLAPVDLLLQRAGRLWRHPWRARPVPGPELLVVSPDPEGEVGARWVRDAFPLAAPVYAHHLVLWRSASELFRRGCVRVPEDVRALVEAVYGPGLAEDAPEALAQASIAAVGRASAERAFAEQNLLRVEDGYGPDGRGWADEGDIATRLGKETATLRLARIEAGLIRPWCQDADPARAWAMSEVTVREVKLRGARDPSPGLAAAARAARAGWSRFDDDVILLPLRERADGGWTGELVGQDGQVLNAFYTVAEGLRIG